MKSSSPPGTMMLTPFPPVPGFGFARSTASLAMSFEVPPPIETVNAVSVRTASRMRCAIVSSDAPS